MAAKLRARERITPVYGHYLFWVRFTAATSSLYTIVVPKACARGSLTAATAAALAALAAHARML
jgi:hypothetical protein